MVIALMQALQLSMYEYQLQLHRMADGIEQKLDMSLDELAKKDRQVEVVKRYRRDGLQRQQGRRNGLNGAGGQGHQQRPLREPLQLPSFGAPNGAYVAQQPGEYARMRPVGGMRQQHGWQSGGRGQGGPQRPSVFSRLTEVPQPQYYQLPQQVEPVPPQQYAQQQLAMSRQQQQFQQPTPRRPSPQPPAPQLKLAAPDLQCRLDKATGLVIIQHNDTDIVKVGPRGDVTLDSGGDHRLVRLAAINAALSHIDMSVKEGGNTWSISDGKGLLRFADGVKLPAKGPLTAGRAMVLLQALTASQSKAATAAQQASMQAAEAAGIVRRAAAAAGPVGAAVDERTESAATRRLKAQGRYAPY